MTGLATRPELVLTTSLSVCAGTVFVGVSVLVVLLLERLAGSSSLVIHALSLLLSIILLVLSAF